MEMPFESNGALARGRSQNIPRQIDRSEIIVRDRIPLNLAGSLTIRLSLFFTQIYLLEYFSTNQRIYLLHYCMHYCYVCIATCDALQKVTIAHSPIDEISPRPSWSILVHPGPAIDLESIPRLLPVHPSWIPPQSLLHFTHLHSRRDTFLLTAFRQTL